MERRLGFCGDECSACPRYLATLATDEGELRRVAELWHALGFRDRVVTVEEIRCTGCSAEHPCAHGIAACAGARGVKHCGRCGDYRSCALIERCFERTDRMGRQLLARGTSAEHALLVRAFLRKRENLG
jgi:hypothetical protein